MALTKPHKGQETKQEHNASSGLTQKGNAEEQAAADPGDRVGSENAVNRCGVSKAIARSRAEVAIQMPSWFPSSRADRTEPEITLRTYPAIWLIAVKTGVELRSSVYISIRQMGTQAIPAMATKALAVSFQNSYVRRNKSRPIR